MQITAITTSFDPGNAVCFAEAAAGAREPDRQALAALCARLSGVEGEDPDAIADSLADFPMPPGFLHARVFDASTGVEFASVVARNSRPLTTDTVSLLITLSEPFLFGRWVETTPLPVRDPGVLDLLVRFEPRDGVPA